MTRATEGRRRTDSGPGGSVSSIGFVQPETTPRHRLLRAAEMLNDGQEVAILVGQDAAHAEDDVIEAAELPGCGIEKALAGTKPGNRGLPRASRPAGHRVQSITRSSD